ncbi:unnamed protein product [Camellia sinensis]
MRLPKSLDSSSSSGKSHSFISDSLEEIKSSCVSNISVSKLANSSFITRIPVPVPNIAQPISNSNRSFVPKFLGSPVASTPALLNSY